MMQSENLYDLISLKLSGEASIADLQDLEQHLEQNPQDRVHAEMLEKIWKEGNIEVSVDSKAAFSRHMSKVGPRLSLETENATKSAEPAKVVSIKKSFLRITAVAASILLVVLSVFFFTNKGNNGTVDKTTAVNLVTAKYGLKKKLLLPDGTQVWLNSGSSITYSKNFSTTHRELQLTGEAFFDVVKDVKHPFIIHTKVMDVKVLGTAFNIRSYPDEGTTETSLVRGRVQIILHQNPSKNLFLNPNDKVIIQNASLDIEKELSAKVAEPKVVLTQMHQLQQDSTSFETSWVSNKLSFDNETLGHIALKLERWFDVKVKIQDESLKAGTYYGVFDEENLEEVLTALQLTGNFHFRIVDEKEVIITP
jgi:ferric-dicitrate binding protein FerR (iron transport regulator)